MRKKVTAKDILIAILAVSLAAAYPWVFLYSTNINEVALSDIALPYLLFAACGLALAAIMCLLRVPISKAGCLSAIFLFLFYIYRAFENIIVALLPYARYWHVLPVVLILYGIFAWWFARKASGAVTDIAKVIVPLLFGVLVAMNLVTAIPAGIQKINAGKDVQQQTSTVTVSQTDSAKNDQPNIYLMVFDEYASFHQLEEYYNFDNAEFKVFLEDNGFMVSMNSRNEYPATNVVLTNMVNLEYIVNSRTSTIELESLHESPALYTFMEQCGYTINGAGDTTWLGIEKMNSEKKGATSVEGYSLNTLFLQSTMIYPVTMSTGSAAKKEMDLYFSELANIAQIPNSSQFTLFYITCPHQPFLYNANGGAVSANDIHNWSDQSVYLGQLKYTNRQIENAVKQILREDSDSVIIICSDHGARGNREVEFPMEEKARILMACYYRGEYHDQLLDLSGVNTLRSVLDMLGLGELNMLEVPYEY